MSSDNAQGPGQPATGQTGPGRRRGSGFWPFVLIGLGLLLLLGNLGIGLGPVFRFLLEWAARLAALWPLALVAIGADMLTRGRYRLAIVSLTIGVAVVWSWSLGPVTGRSETVPVDIPLSGATQARVALKLGVSPIALSSAPGTGSLLWGTAVPATNERVEQRSSRRGGVVDAQVGVRSEGPGLFAFNWGTTAQGTWQLYLDEGVPTDLDIDGGVGRLTLDLRTATLNSFDLDVGVGEVTVTLPASGAYAAEIDGGVGMITVIVPESLAIGIEVKKGVGAVDVESGFTKVGERYLSPAAAGSPGPTASLRVNAGVGKVVVRTVR